MRIIRREIELSFKFTLGPGEMPDDERDALAQLTALATKMNGGVLPAGLVEGLADQHRPSPIRPYTMAARPWHCGSCASMGETDRGAASHASFHPTHALIFEGATP